MESIIGKQFPEKVIPLIDQTKRSIEILVFDWRWYPQDPGAAVQLFNQAIARAATRGVAVRAIVNNQDLMNHLSLVGVRAKRLSLKNLLHAKLMIFDGENVVLGSHNFTQHAFTTNFEVSAYLPACPAAPEFLRFFETLWRS